MKVLDLERVVTLSAADLEALLDAVVHLSVGVFESAVVRDKASGLASVCAIQGIVEQLRGKFYL